MSINKVKAFLYFLLIYAPIGIVGTIAIFIANSILTYPVINFFTIIVGANTMIFGTALLIISFSEPLIKLLYNNEVVISSPSFKINDVSTHPEESAVGVKITPEYDINEVGNKIINKECDILGKPYCIQIARKSGLNVDDSGKIISSNKITISDLEKLVRVYVNAFGKPALYASETVLSKYPKLKYTPVYKTL